MTNQEKPLSTKKPNAPKKSESQSYLAIGMTFALVGLALLIPEGTRATGLPFLVLGFTFYIIGRGSDSTKGKK